MISVHDVWEPLKEALLASRDVIISSQICVSKLQRFFTLGDGCWLPNIVPLFYGLILSTTGLEGFSGGQQTFLYDSLSVVLCTCFFPAGVSTLTELTLNENMIRGSVPTGLSPVMTFNARGNALTGSIPAAVGCLASLICVFLSANRLTGCIPATLGQLRSLRVVGLGENSLTGAVPDCFRSCRDLQGLLLDNSMLEGTLPSSLTQLGRLSHLDLSAGQAQRAARRVHLQGGIPDISCPLWENQLYRGGPLLLLHGQKFEGRLRNMSSSLLVLTIHENRFEGMPAIVNCRNGARVTVHRNWLSCGIPTLKCGRGGRLDLSLVGIGNSFFNPKGSFPSWIMPFERSSLLWASRTEGFVFLVQTCMGGLAVLLSFRLRVTKRQVVDAIARFAADGKGAVFLKICCDTCLHAGCQCILGCAVILVMLSSDFPFCPASLRRLSTLLMWDRWVLVAIIISWRCWCHHMSLPWWIAARCQRIEAVFVPLFLAGAYSYNPLVSMSLR